MKFSIVTPAYNMAPWIWRTIETVLDQAGDFDIEYIVMDDGSTDRTAAIAEEYAKKVNSGTYPVKARSVTMQVVSQENTGMYEAINRGFARATGDIFAWINADDTYAPGAFEAIAKTFETFPDIQWLKGITDVVNEEWEKQYTNNCNLYRQDWLRAGVYGMEAYFVQQDSVFWRKELWQKVAPMPKNYRGAADYWLWIQMANYAPLWSLNVHVSNFMKRAGQISSGVTKYKLEQRQIRPHRSLAAWSARFFFWPPSRFPSLQWFFLSAYPVVCMGGTREYIDFNNGSPIKKPAPSYIC